MNKKNEIQTAWSKAVNDKTNWSYKDKRYGNKVQGKLNTKQYFAYNIIRGLPLDRGYTDNETFANVVKSFFYLLDRCINAQGANKERALALLGVNYLTFFGDTVDVTEFVEKADEAIRLYSNS